MPQEREKTNTGIQGRLLSLDVFRGLTILGMLLVNNIELDYATPKQLVHAGWNKGVHFADMVFPWFLFIVGVAVPYAFASFRKKNEPIWKFYSKAFKRMLMLVFIGCLIDSCHQKAPVFDLGVLQIIGMAFFVAVLIYPLKLHWRLCVAAGLLLAHWALIRFVPYGGAFVGEFAETRNIIRHLNDVYLSRYHLQGLVSVVPTSALVLIGSAIGDLIRLHDMEQKRKLTIMLLSGCILGLMGYLWSYDLPYNKPVWTSSYILYTAGWASVVLGAIYFIVDMKGIRKWAFPLIVFGTNAIAAYAIPILVKLMILQTWTWTMPNGLKLPLQQAYLGALMYKWGAVGGGVAYTLSYLLVWWIVMYIFYRKNIFLKV